MRNMAEETKSQVQRAKKEHLKEVVDFVAARRRSQHHQATLEAKLIIELLINNVFIAIDKRREQK